MKTLFLKINFYETKASSQSTIKVLFLIPFFGSTVLGDDCPSHPTFVVVSLSMTHVTVPLLHSLICMCCDNSNQMLKEIVWHSKTLAIFKLEHYVLKGADTSCTRHMADASVVRHKRMVYSTKGFVPNIIVVIA